MASVIKFLLLLVFADTFRQAKFSDNVDLHECGLTDSTLRGKQFCDYPWTVAVLNVETGQLCTGSFITKQHVMTPRTCLYSSPGWPSESKRVRVYYRSLKFKMKRIRVHASRIHSDENIAVLKLRSPFNITVCSRPVCLPTASEWAEEADDCMAIELEIKRGKGKKLTYYPKTVEQTVMKFELCAYSYLYHNRDFVSFCTHAKKDDFCMNDTGRAFVCKHFNGRYYLYGVGFPGNEYYCGATVSRYKRLSILENWIKVAVGTL